MKILFIGGTGIISSACSELALERGIELHLLKRGKSDRPVPKGAVIRQADIRDADSVRRVLGDERFDAVVDFVAFSTAHIETDLALFKGKVGQYVFISSASIYQTPPARLPVTESTPLKNSFWEYSRNKIACEELLIRAYREVDFPATIVRPSHTYDRRCLPFHGGYTVIDRMRKNQPVVVHGDGSSLWTLTHHRDFAKAFVGLLGNPLAVGDTFHITSDEALTWDQIHHISARAAGVEARLVHVASDRIAELDAGWGASLLGDKTHSMVFDNTKIKRLVPDFVATIPWARGIEEVLAWYDADAARRTLDAAVNTAMDQLIARYGG
jgi:nucleoside-diphosphate-sugar epimerase